MPEIAAGASAAGTSPCHDFPPADAISEAATLTALSTGMAKPMPCAPALTATLTPIISPSIFTSGPPELPGLIGARKSG